MAERDPALASALDEQRRALTLIRGAAAEVRAPLALRERLEADRRRLARPRARRRWLSVATAGALAAAVLLAVVLATPGAPTVEDAAAFAAEGPTAPAPEAEGKLLAAEQSGVAFPEWGAKFGWEATGTRTGEIDGRAATTVYYENAEGRTLAYTIVGGDALDSPEDSRTIEAAGTPVEIFRTAEGTPAATWEREGHTCVLSGQGVPDAKLAELAGWKGMGDVAF